MDTKIEHVGSKRARWREKRGSQNIATKMRGKKNGYKTKTDRPTTLQTTVFCSRGGNIGRGKTLPEEYQGSGMLEEERKTSKPPVPRALVGLSN